MQAYLFNDYWEDIGTIRSFFEANLALTEHVSVLLWYTLLHLICNQHYLAFVFLVSVQCALKTKLTDLFSCCLLISATKIQLLRCSKAHLHVKKKLATIKDRQLQGYYTLYTILQKSHHEYIFLHLIISSILSLCRLLIQ